MIKVNLLKDQATRPRKALATPKVSRIGLIFLAIVVLVAGAMGFWTLHVHRQIQTGREKREELRIRDAQLQMLKKEIDRFEKLKQQRQSRIDVIEQLKTNQTGPVLLLNKSSPKHPARRSTLAHIAEPTDGHHQNHRLHTAPRRDTGFYEQPYEVRDISERRPRDDRGTEGRFEIFTHMY